VIFINKFNYKNSDWLESWNGFSEDFFLWKSSNEKKKE